MFTSGAISPGLSGSFMQLKGFCVSQYSVSYKKFWGFAPNQFLSENKRAKTMFWKFSACGANLSSSWLVVSLNRGSEGVSEH